MSRTLRKDRVGKVYPEGQKMGVWYRCKCSYCTSRDRVHQLEAVADNEIKDGVDYMYGRTVVDEYEYSFEYYNKQFTALEQEELNWEEYQRKQAA